MLDFPESAGMDTQNNLSRVYDDIVNASFSLFNEKEYFNRVFDAVKIISASIDSLNSKLYDLKKKFDYKMDDANIKNLMEHNNQVPVEVFNIIREVVAVQRDIISWNIVKNKFLEVLSQKQNEILGVVKVLEVEKEALKRFDAIQKQNFENMKVLTNVLVNGLKQELVVSKKEELNIIMSNFNKLFVVLAQKGVDYKVIDDFSKILDEKVKVLEKNFSRKVENVLKSLKENSNVVDDGFGSITDEEEDDFESIDDEEVIVGNIKEENDDEEVEYDFEDLKEEVEKKNKKK